MSYCRELFEKSKFYLYIICNLLIDGLFILIAGYILSEVHYHWLPDLNLDGYYKKTVDYIVYILDLSILPALFFRLAGDLINTIRREMRNKDKDKDKDKDKRV